MVIAIVIFVLALALVMLRPKPFNEATAAALGAALMLAAGVVSPAQALSALRDNANVLLFFLGLMLVSTVADRAGFFEWTAVGAVRLARGSSPALLLIVFALGACITTFFSNDATALILTPIVYVLVTRFKLNPLPFVFACAFIANTASMVLPVSNPVNLLPVDRFGLGLGEYLRFLLLPSILVIALNMGLFAFVFRKHLSASFADGGRQQSPTRVDPFFLFVCCGLALTAAGYVLTSVYRLPLALPALGGAVLLVAGSIAFGRLSLVQAGKGVSWYIFLFIFSLALLVRGLENAGVSAALGQALAALPSRVGDLGAIVSTTFLTAFGANLINNWSMMMVSVVSLDVSHVAATSNHELIYASILGADLGPNIAVVGSLSSMLWLVLLRRRGLDIHPLQFLRLGLIVTPPMLLAGALGIYISARLWG